MAEPIKLGILSTAGIAVTILEALKPITTIKAAVVASRSLSKAEAFALKYNIPKAVEYDDLFKEDVDAVYVPLPTGLAAEWAARCARAGFHVLVDKPFASVESIEQILQACREASVYFMDATHFVHAHRTQIVKERIANGEIGDIKRIVSTFCTRIKLEGNIRGDPELEPMGALGDLGWYTARSVVACLGVERARDVSSVSVEAKFHDSYPGIVDSADGVVVFGEDKKRVLLSFHVDQSCCFDETVNILGTIGKIEVPEFIIPKRQTDVFRDTRPSEAYTTDTNLITVKSVKGFAEGNSPHLTFPIEEEEVVKEIDGLSQPSAMMVEFGRMIREKDDSAAKKWADESLTTQRILDVIWEKVRKYYAP